MDIRKLALGTVAGGIVLFATGWLIFTTAFGAFYAANGGSATGVDREAQVLWAMGVGNLAYAALIAYVLAGRGKTPSVGDGFKVGAIVGFLMWLAVDFVLFGSTNIATLTRTVVDPLLEIVHGGAGGAAVAAVLAMGSGAGASKG